MPFLKQLIMKKTFTLFFFFIILFVKSNAQDATVQGLKDASGKSIKKDPTDTSAKKWKMGGLFNLNINQGALSNWAAGGDKASFSLTSFLNLYAFYKKGKHSWDNNLDLAYGMVNTTSLGQRKADDRIDFLTKYGYEVAPKWYLSGLFNLRTQFADGYAYPKDGNKIRTSRLFAPAYLLVSLGIDFKPTDNFSLFLSPVTSRWVIVSDDSLSAAGAYGVSPGKKSLNEIGAYVSVNFSKNLNQNSTYKTRLDLFSNYKHNPQNIDVYWTNLLAVKVTKFINITLNVDVLYDDDVHTVKEDGSVGGPKPQIKELTGIGFAWKF